MLQKYGQSIVDTTNGVKVENSPLKIRKPSIYVCIHQHTISMVCRKLPYFQVTCQLILREYANEMVV